jgi:type II secretory ATPase GspE/PulE/Tfp pilus assembly ATPase PilB-like protein
MDVYVQHHAQHGKLSMLHEGLPLEFWVTIVPTVNGESTVLRPLTPEAKLLKIEQLNLAPHYHGMLQKVLTQPYGLFLVVGPAGSGKATTLHALLNRLNTPDHAIWTVENLVKISQKGLQQVQANTKNGLTHAEALRSVMLCEPDIIMVGEMRDREVVEMSIEAASTDRLVFSSLLCASASEAVVWLMDLGVEKSGLADALLGVISQRLVRKLCSHCKRAVPLSLELLGKLRSLYGGRFDEDCASYLGQTGTVFRRGTCQVCHGTGFHGHMAIQELLVASPQLKRLISHGARGEQINDAAGDTGMRTLLQDRIAKVLQGHLDLDEVRGAN